MTTLEVLRAARDLISDPARWTTGVDARNADQIPVPADSPAAVCWCVVGAIGRVVRLYGGGNLTDAYQALHDVMPRTYGLISQYNDAHTHAENLALVDRAIVRLEAETQP